jgi:hypothetical protein
LHESVVCLMHATYLDHVIILFSIIAIVGKYDSDGFVVRYYSRQHNR